jgi:nucleoside-diphosphate-sugar epimerase
MNILLTGHTGFIGSHLWEIIESKNDTTEIFGISTDECFNASSLVGNRSFDRVYHLAASLNKNLSPFENSQLTMNILDMYTKWEGKSFIHTSTVSVGLKNSSFYFLSKKLAEEMCSFYVQKYDINVCSIRLPSVYGPRMKSETVIDKFIRAALEGKDITLYGRGERKQFFGYVKDVAAILELAGRESLRGVFLYPCSSISMKLLAETIIDILDSKSIIKYIDIQEDELKVFRTPILPFKQPYGLKEGIKDYAEWIKEESNRR